MSMNLLRLFGSRNATAPVARERLQILLAHERGLLGQPDLLVTLREEILVVVSRHIQIDPGRLFQIELLYDPFVDSRSGENADGR